MMRKIICLVICVIVLVGCGKVKPLSQRKELNSRSMALAEADILLESRQRQESFDQVCLPQEVKEVLEIQTQREDKQILVFNEQLPNEVPETEVIQKVLKVLDLYEGDVDGKIGPKTIAAIIRLQEEHDLVSDGVVGPQTWAVLKKTVENQNKTKRIVSAN